MTARGRMYASSLLHRKPAVENIRPAPAAALWRHTSEGETGHEGTFDAPAKIVDNLGARLPTGGHGCKLITSETPTPASCFATCAARFSFPTGRAPCTSAGRLRCDQVSDTSMSNDRGRLPSHVVGRANCRLTWCPAQGIFDNFSQIGRHFNARRNCEIRSLLSRFMHWSFRKTTTQ
jgi:hypothetical protein